MRVLLLGLVLVAGCNSGTDPQLIQELDKLKKEVAELRENQMKQQLVLIENKRDIANSFESLGLLRKSFVLLAKSFAQLSKSTSYNLTHVAQIYILTDNAASMAEPPNYEGLEGLMDRIEDHTRRLNESNSNGPDRPTKSTSAAKQLVESTAIDQDDLIALERRILDYMIKLAKESEKDATQIDAQTRKINDIIAEVRAHGSEIEELYMLTGNWQKFKDARAIRDAENVQP